MNRDAVEVNFDGLVGPTHQYGGLSYGNLASMSHRKILSHPRQAALQALEKMKLLHDLGIPQGILPPQERPDLYYLRAFGFRGTDAEILQKSWKEVPLLLSSCCSSSSMWAANAATVTPSSETFDKKVHFTVANLQNRFHRSIEAETTFRIFKHIFNDERFFIVHPPLPSGGSVGDEGAANHTRFCKNYGDAGVHLFVYGHQAFEEEKGFRKFPARQSLEASMAIVRRHGIPKERVVFAKQNPELIEAGIFHNDVISVGDQNIFLFHERAFVDSEKILQELSNKIEKSCGCKLLSLPISEKDLSIEEAIKTYFFNSQLVSSKQGKAFIAPKECETLKIPLPIKLQTYFIDLRQSMQNGGGPACMRLRVVLTKEELEKINSHFLYTEEMHRTLKLWIEKHFRDSLSTEDLSDPSLLQESRTALDHLTQILKMGSFYSFQKERSS